MTTLEQLLEALVVQGALVVANEEQVDETIHVLGLAPSDVIVQPSHTLEAASDEGEIPTPAQGLALARFLRPRFRPANRDAFATVARGGFGLPNGYVLVRFPDGYEGGIARDGRTST